MANKDRKYFVEVAYDLGYKFFMPNIRRRIMAAADEAEIGRILRAARLEKAAFERRWFA